MATQLTVEDARQSMQAHVASKGDEIHQKYGPHLGWSALQDLLSDRAYVRYPCEIIFDAAPLLDGEFAHAAAKGERPEDGFTIIVHPYFGTQVPRVPYLVLYQLVLVNYGEFASAEDAELFGAHSLGLPREEYYRALCAMADEIAQPAS
jgi:hypothetical protein